VTAILGLSAFYHDSAAALVVDGRLVAASQEERYSRQKHDAALPARAAAFCLSSAGLAPPDLDYIVFYEKPFAKFERLLETYLAYAPSGFRSFKTAMPVWMGSKLFLRRAIRSAFPAAARAKLVFADHHESHAASAFFPSPFDEAAILTLDGVGEWSTTTSGVGRGNHLALDRHIEFPHSLGLLYSAFTYYCGFKVNSGEYKLMGLAPYGRPIYRDQILAQLVDVKDDGSFWLDMDYFNYATGLTMTNPRFHASFGGPPRTPESPIEQRHMDLAASIQAVTEEIVLRLGRDLHARTGLRRLVLAGGVALNCVANGRLRREGPFDDIWIQPGAGDAGGAIGAALFTWHQLLDQPRTPASPDQQNGSLLGDTYSRDEVAAFLDSVGETYRRIDDEPALMAEVARLLADGRVVGWFTGPMEFGPRALGARSILADARRTDTQATLNLKIKFRESFRPFAPCVLAERAHEWFDVAPGEESPYMLLVASVRADRLLPIGEADRTRMTTDPDLRRRVEIPRSTIPAVTHVDNSARLQTVDAVRSPPLHALLTAFEARTGCPVLVNTSFNVRGEPIVRTPAEAHRGFLATRMDVLVLESCIVEKAQGAEPSEAVTRSLLAAHAPD
jgi:carbamoyltransferase